MFKKYLKPIFVVCLTFVTIFFHFLNVRYVGPAFGINMIAGPSITPTFTTNAVATSTPVSSSCVLTSSTRYGFDCDISGWEKTNFYQNQAIQTVTTAQFNNENKTPSQVLALTVNFTGTIEERKKQFRESGEVQVDLNGFPPFEYETKSVGLHDVTIVTWIWAPQGSIGDPSHKNGVQLFVKDINNKNCYGAWNNISQEEIWFRVSWQENNAVLCDSGFDSSKPSLLGVKIAIGKDSIWTANDLLTFYVDDVDWQPP
jgi:hypothetical protein